MLSTVFAFDRIVRVGARRQTDLGWRARASATASRIHRGEKLRIVGEDQPTCGGGRTGNGCVRIGRRPEELAVGGVAEIEAAVTALRGDQVGTRRHGLCLQSFY